MAEREGELLEAPIASASRRTIGYDGNTLTRIRARAVEQFLAIPRGGLEVGGLLFGRFLDPRIEISGFEELEIDHLAGPRFQLSAADEQMLSARLGEARPAEVVGWWHSHTRSGVEITEEDLRVHAQFFRDPRQIALILKPHQFDPAQVAVYDGNGELLSAFAFGEAVLKSTPAAPVHQALPVNRDPIERPVLQPRAGLTAPAERRVRSGLWKGAAILIPICAIAVAIWTRPVPEPAPVVVAVDPIRLAVTESGAQMTVRWDRDQSAAARDAEVVIIDEGQVTRIPLSPDTPATGTLGYARRGTHVEVRMRGRLQDGELFEAVAHYVGPEKHATPAPLPIPEAPKTTETVAREKQTAQVATPARRLTAVPPVQVRSRQEVQLIAPPSVAAPGNVEAVRLPVPGASAPPPPPPPPPPTRVSHQPSSGRAIWTGVLPRGGVLIVDRARASSGSLTGKLPQSPSRVRVYPADLTESGVVVYTAGTRERTEAPSAANGWNVTTYRPDARRARDLTVLEAPGEGNSWQRLMVRSDQRPISVLLIEWETIE